MRGVITPLPQCASMGGWSVKAKRKVSPFTFMKQIVCVGDRVSEVRLDSSMFHISRVVEIIYRNTDHYVK
jgi:hypothetical protein